MAVVASLPVVIGIVILLVTALILWALLR